MVDEVRYIPVTREFLEKLLDGLVCGYPQHFMGRDKPLPVTWFGQRIDWDSLMKKQDLIQEVTELLR